MFFSNLKIFNILVLPLFQNLTFIQKEDSKGCVEAKWIYLTNDSPEKSIRNVLLNPGKLRRKAGGSGRNPEGGDGDTRRPYLRGQVVSTRGCLEPSTPGAILADHSHCSQPFSLLKETTFN